ncbi:anti-sigma factor family protein [Variovorax sp. GT1P44]|uniref:anti-sigma factor family protein n=1 Tax=Variovorax sp. GT1P44 TaxID=3443742 RepID=UPI003F476E0B
MTGRVVYLDTDVHQKVQSMLPWYVGASLDADERARIEAHLAECPHCQAELALERALHGAYPTEIAAPADVDQGFALLRERIAVTAPPRQRQGLLARLGARWRECPAWTRWAMLAQGVLVAALCGVLILPIAPEQRFRALGDPGAAPGAAGNLIVRFRPEATEQEMRRVLRDSRARLVYGPTTTDAYLLAVPAGLEATAVKQLRQEKAVLLVESLDGRAVP